MRISVQHTETFAFEPPALSTIQVCRLTPRDHTGHYVCDWSVEVDADCDLTSREDAFGNIISSFSINRPIEKLTIVATGEIETEQHHGIVRGTREAVPQGVFLRHGDDHDHVALAKQLVGQAVGDDLPPIDHMHALMKALHEAAAPHLAEDNAKLSDAQSQSQRQHSSPSSTGFSERLSATLLQSQGTPGGALSSVLADAARIIHLPARLISGHRLLDADAVEIEARHVWAEVFIDKLGWIGFDPINNNCPSDESVRVAAGLNLPGISALRSSYHTQLGEPKRETTIALSHA